MRGLQIPSCNFFVSLFSRIRPTSFFSVFSFLRALTSRFSHLTLQAHSSPPRSTKLLARARLTHPSPSRATL